MQAIYTGANKKVELASFNRRILAFTIDILLLLSLIGLIDYLTYSSDEQAYLLKPERFLDLSLGWLYFAGMEVCSCQGTIGKYLLGLQVTNLDGSRITFKNATIRYFVKPFSAIMVLFRLLLNPIPLSRRTFHDKLAQSIVISR